MPALEGIAKVSGARTALDMFTGTTRVAQGFKGLGIETIANDIASYSKVLADCYISTDADTVDYAELEELLRDLGFTTPKEGYFTETFCKKARFFQPKNGARIDAIRDRIEAELKGSAAYSIALTSLMEAADRVDSTTGVQMAYLKKWAARSYNDLELRVPQLLKGGGTAYQKDANELVDEVEEVDLIYLDPPYNQHRYFTNYHIWETLVRWDHPEVYGVACKRVDAREEATKSAYNKKREMKDTFFELISKAKAKLLVISYNNESWITAEEMQQVLQQYYPKQLLLSFDYKRYVGAQIGVHNLEGKKVGTPTHLRNLEYVFIAGDGDALQRIEKHSSSTSSP